MLNKLRNFLIGRNGIDALTIVLMVTGSVLTCVLSFVKVKYVYLIGYIPYILAVMRILSKNIIKRRAENDKFLKFIDPWKRFIQKKMSQYKDTEHKYYNCPGCNRTLRVPKGRGKIKISCPHCSREFTKKT